MTSSDAPVIGTVVREVLAELLPDVQLAGQAPRNGATPGRAAPAAPAAPPVPRVPAPPVARVHRPSQRPADPVPQAAAPAPAAPRPAPPLRPLSTVHNGWSNGRR